MKFSENKVILVGNFVSDPELRYTPSGTAVTQFRFATNRRIKKNDQYEDEPTFHMVVCWTKLAELIGKDGKKGAKAYISGRIQNRSYDKDGEKRYVSEIVAEDVILFVKNTSGNTSNNPTPPSEDQTPEPTEADVNGSDDMPF